MKRELERLLGRVRDEGGKEEKEEKREERREKLAMR